MGHVALAMNPNAPPCPSDRGARPAHRLVEVARRVASRYYDSPEVRRRVAEAILRDLGGQEAEPPRPDDRR